MEIIVGEACGEEMDFHGSRPPGCTHFVEGWLQLSSGTHEGLLGNWAEVDLSK